MRTLILILLLLVALPTFAFEEPEPVNIGNYHISYSMVDKSDYIYRTYLRFHYNPVLHVFIHLDGWQANMREVNTGLIGAILPFSENFDFGMGVGNNYPTGSLFMTYTRISLSQFEVESIWKIGSVKPQLNTRVSLNLEPIELCLQHTTEYGFNLGLNLVSGPLVVGTGYNPQAKSVFWTIALIK